MSKQNLPGDGSAVWFYLDPATNQTNGPVNAYGLAGLLDSSVISIDCLVWAEGQEDWKPLKESLELYSQVYHISSSGASVMPEATAEAHPGALPVQDVGSAAAELAAASSQRSRRGAVAASKPAVTARPAVVDDQLADFQAEMAALGEDTGPVDAPDGERVATPPFEEQEFEDDDGTVYKWDLKLRKFQPKAAGQPGEVMNYGLEEMTFAAEEETIPVYNPPAEDDESGEDEKEPKESAVKEQPEPPVAVSSGEPEGSGGQREAKRGKKRGGAEEVFERIADKQKKAKMQEEAQKQWFDLKVNTSVYITGLPDDISEAQLAERFAQYGVLKPGEDGAPRVKLYRDKATQMPKGDGLVTFLYQPSVSAPEPNQCLQGWVELACNLAGDDCFRPGMAKRMTVQPAKFEMHGAEYIPKKKGNKKKSSKDKAKLADKVLGWGGFDDKLKPTQVTVILKNLFHPSDFEEEPSLLKDLEADIREECGKLGTIDKVRVFAGNPEGVVSVKFKADDGAQTCLKKMQGRYFGGRQVEASMWDGFTNYNVKVQETEEQQAARLERFAREIEDQRVQEQLQREMVQEAANTQQENGT